MVKNDPKLKTALEAATVAAAAAEAASTPDGTTPGPKDPAAPGGKPDAAATTFDPNQRPPEGGTSKNIPQLHFNPNFIDREILANKDNAIVTDSLPWNPEIKDAIKNNSFNVNVACVDMKIKNVKTGDLLIKNCKGEVIKVMPDGDKIIRDKENCITYEGKNGIPKILNCKHGTAITGIDGKTKYLDNVGNLMEIPNLDSIKQYYVKCEKVGKKE